MMKKEGAEFPPFLSGAARTKPRIDNCGGSIMSLN